MHNVSPLADALRKCIAAERAAIVTYLRRRLCEGDSAAAELVDAVEAGAHLRDVGRPTVAPIERIDHARRRLATDPNRHP